MELATIVINKIEYVHCDLVMKAAPIYSKGSRNSRMLVKNKCVPVESYIFARCNGNNEWVETGGKSIKVDKVLLKKEFLVNVAELCRKEKGEMIVHEKRGNREIEIREAPDVIELDDSEKFRDDNGNAIDIETMGVRSCDGVFFSGKGCKYGI